MRAQPFAFDGNYITKESYAEHLERGRALPEEDPIYSDKPNFVFKNAPPASTDAASETPPQEQPEGEPAGPAAVARKR